MPVSRVSTDWLAGVSALLMMASGCATRTPQPCPSVATTPSTRPSADRPSPRAAIDRLLDGWHAAAARADEEAYFDAMSDTAIFLGTDAKERWRKADFRRYAHPHFAKGRAWSFEPVRREVIVGPTGKVAWFDEDLATPNLGPARGSGVVVEEGGRWRIAHYNLAITVPNERFDAVKALLEADGPAAPR